MNDPELTAVPANDFNSGYVLRALHTLPQQGSKTPWRVHQNYVKDLSMLRFGRVDDGTMEFKVACRAQRGCGGPTWLSAFAGKAGTVSALRVFKKDFVSCR